MAEITTTQSFSDGDTVTATKLNNIQGNASIQPEAITNRSAETSIDQANDLLLVYDASATALKKVSASNLIKAGTASDFPITGNATIGGTLGVAGVSTLTGNTSVGGTLAVNGAITATSTINGTTIPTTKTLVTTVDTQTLTNKTLTSPSISTPAITGQITASTSIINVGSGQIYKDASGNVGIGITNPSVNLEVVGTSGMRTRYDASGFGLLINQISSAGDAYVINQANAGIVLATNNTERLRIASSGQIGIGGANYGTSGQVVTSGGSSVSPSWATNPVGFRNRIINGDMRIDQRNAGASVTPTIDSTYVVDRWNARLTQASKFSIAQNAGSVTPPAGYKNYLGITSLSAYSVLTSDYFMISQSIEGYNFADLMFGTSSAQTFTFSFWVRSSLTGTFGGSFQGATSATLRSYPFSYTISSANTWEQKTIIVAGDTFTNTWESTNAAGILVNFGLGVGSSISGTAGSWASANTPSATSAVSVVGTNGATFYITGVQFEAGSTATDFERRPIGTELALCQRYFSKSYDLNIAVGASGDPVAGLEYFLAAFSAQTGNLGRNFTFPVPMRAIPTVTTYDRSSPPNSGKVTTNGGGNKTANQIAVGQRSTTIYVGGSGESELTFHWAAAAEL